MPHWMPNLNGTGGGTLGDPRDLLEKLRRKEVNAVLDAEGIEHPDYMAADAARMLIRSQGIDVGKYIDEVGNFLWPEKNERKVDVDSMKMPDLRKFCAGSGIKWAMSDKKVDLQRKVREYLGQ